MPTFKIECEETLKYDVTIEAADENEAVERVLSNNFPDEAFSSPYEINTHITAVEMQAEQADGVK